jgi:hypothetical protein
MGLSLEKSDIDWIRTRLSAGEVTRSGLSRELCQRMGWHDPLGRPREMAARVLLGNLDRRLIITLPPPVRIVPARQRVVRIDQQETLSLTVPSAAPCVFNIEDVMVRLVEQVTERREWASVMDRFHYLGAGPLCGAQLKYLVYLGSELIGGLAFSAAAYSLRERDDWIGWSKEAREHNLPLVVCNSRFLLTVRIPNLASHVLGRVTARLADDWHERYGLRPLLVETFVEKGRFSGTCYRAAGWEYLGDTAGRGRNDTGHEGKVPVKHIFVSSLDRTQDWRRILCRKPVKELPDGGSWAAHEFGSVDLGDARLTARLVTVAEDFFSKPTANIPEACGSRAKTKAVYRLCSTPHATMDTLLAGHIEATLSRCSKESRVFAIQDTTSLNYTTHPSTTDLGPIGSFGAQATLGLLVHSVFTLNESDTPLGLLHVNCWVRPSDAHNSAKGEDRYELPIEEKESYKWIKGFHATVEAAHRAPSTEFVVMGDREADIFELFDEHHHLAPKNLQILIRACHPRRIRLASGGKSLLWEHVLEQPVSDQVMVTVPRRGKRASRDAQVAIRFAEVTIEPPDKLSTKHYKPLTLSAIAAVEVNPPEGVEPLQWLLLSTLPVTTFEQACEKIVWYTKRWHIEVFHRTLKSGCRIENRQLGSAHSIKAALSIDLVVAWRIFHLAKLGREVPDAPCTLFFEEHEWKALVCFSRKNPVPPEQPPTLKEALIMVATLGGFLGRKSDGMPGTQTLWRGLERLSDISAACALFFNST